jgi:2-polyprenyl-3-methyl-5-hydroxy-6-metoxy-1,4-benzoquinol methylase
VFSDTWESLKDYCLHLIHLKAYEYATELSAGKSVLDLGCNNGYGTNELARSCREVVGVDVSPSAIADAEQRFVADGLAFRVIDGTGLPFRSEMFDVVTSFQVIEHVAEMPAYLNEINRVLKPGGVAIFTTPNARIRLDPGMRSWNKFHFQEFGADDLASTLQTSFRRVAVRGLFAIEELYQVEYDRCQAALAKARRRQARDRRKQKMRLLPPLKLKKIRAALKSKLGLYRSAGAVTGGVDPALQARYSTSDFFYRDDDLGRALDLMAICHK